MKEKENLLSIGKLAKLSDVHIRSLRYYEELGILIPAYVDPQSQYRYYTFDQLRIVEAIKYCIELDIPLKEFTASFIDSPNVIDYRKLFDMGTERIHAKIAQLTAQLDYANYIHLLIEHGESCRKDGIIRNFLPQELLWLQPYSDSQANNSTSSMVYNLIDEVHSHGLTCDYLIGLLSVYHGDQQESYVFTNLRNAEAFISQYSQIFVLPAGNYYCTLRDKSQITDAPNIFSEQFTHPCDKYVIEKQVFTGKWNYLDPCYELRCYLVEG